MQTSLAGNLGGAVLPSSMVLPSYSYASGWKWSWYFLKSTVEKLQLEARTYLSSTCRGATYLDFRTIFFIIHPLNIYSCWFPCYRHGLWWHWIFCIFPFHCMSKDKLLSDSTWDYAMCQFGGNSDMLRNIWGSERGTIGKWKAWIIGRESCTSPSPRSTFYVSQKSSHCGISADYLCSWFPSW